MRKNEKSKDDPEKRAEEALRRLTEEIAPEEEGEVRTNFSWALMAAKARGAARELLKQLKMLWAMLTDRTFVMSWETKATIIAALTYFISPLDAVPDAIPGVGYLDDAVVVAWALHRIDEEVARYRQHRKVA